MAKTVTVELSEAIIGHTGPVSRVVIKEPTAGDYFALGEPSVWGRGADGNSFIVENVEVVEGYVSRCVQEPNDPLILNQMSLADAMKVKDAVLGFFGEARRKNSPT